MTLAWACLVVYVASIYPAGLFCDRRRSNRFTHRENNS